MTTEQTEADALRAALAEVQPGDHVTVAMDYGGHAGTVTGEAWARQASLFVCTTIIRYEDGCGPYVTALIEHTPAMPPEPKVDALRIDKDGDVWRRFEDGWSLLFLNGSWGVYRFPWSEVQKQAPLLDPKAFVK